MQIENMVNYICRGLESIPDQEDFRTQAACGPTTAAAVAAVVPVLNYTTIGWQLLGYSFVIIALIGAVIVFKISSKELTVERRLILKIIIYSEWVFQMSMMGTMLFLACYGFSMTVLWLYFPVVTIPLLGGWLIHRRLNSDREYILYETKKTELKWSRLGVSGGSIGTVLLCNLGQDKMAIIVIVICCFVSSVMSWGLLEIQKLYYYKKYNLSEYIK